MKGLQSLEVREIKIIVVYLNLKYEKISGVFEK